MHTVKGNKDFHIISKLICSTNFCYLKIFISCMELTPIYNFLLMFLLLEYKLHGGRHGGSVFMPMLYFSCLAEWLVQDRYSINSVAWMREHISEWLPLPEESWKSFRKEFEWDTEEWIRKKTLQYGRYNCIVIQTLRYQWAKI